MLKPGHLRKFVVSNEAIADVARAQLSMIDARLQQSPKYGRNVVEIPLETTFIGINLAAADAQRLIYTHIIVSLKERGFEVRISIKPDTTMLYVGFNINMSPENIASMNSILRAHHIKDEDIPKFYALTSEQVPESAHTSESTT